MARHRFLLISFCSLLASLPAWSQDPTPSPGSTPVVSEERHTPPGKIPPEKFREMRRKLEKLPPEQREQVIRNFMHMKDLPSDQKDYVRFMNDQRQKKLRKGVDDALAANGLKLDEDQRKKFADIYLRERRKLEEDLRKEMEKRRQELLPTLVQKVTEQYQKEAATPPVEASPSPATTP